MTLLISDANIIIDMEAGEILEDMFRLPDTFAVPNVLYAEELEVHHAHLPGLGLVVLDVHEEYVLEAYRLGDVYKKPSHNDLLALSLAKQESCPLLTGDACLREAAEMEQIAVSGTLWLVDRLFSENIIDYDGANEAYEKMKRDSRRLPWDEVRRQLKRMNA
jgi:predicted nucleic acid-binding protein